MTSDGNNVNNFTEHQLTKLCIV